MPVGDDDLRRHVRPQPGDGRRDQRLAGPGSTHRCSASARPGSPGPYAGRHLPPSDLAKLDPRYDGPIPLRSPDKPLPRGDYLHWGRELGRRFRTSSATRAATTARSRRRGNSTKSCPRSSARSPSRTACTTRASCRVSTWAAAARRRAPARRRLGRGGDARAAAAAADADGLRARGALGRDRQRLAALRRRGVRRLRRRPGASGRTLLDRAAPPARRRADPPEDRAQVRRRHDARAHPLDAARRERPRLADSRSEPWRERFVRARAAVAPVAGFGQFNFTRENSPPA